MTLLENQMERAVLEAINDILMLDSQERFCSCEKFRTDVAALVLNQLRPRYANSFQGSLYTLEAIQSDQDLQAQIAREVMVFMQVVVDSPRCLEQNCPLKMDKMAVEMELAPQPST
ncbi:MAG: late competence development ComFB family protein [Cyanobacteriota bacterium]|nr:late competence development ComFB family protein [Cyanobacteriota bacterium]